MFKEQWYGKDGKGGTMPLQSQQPIPKSAKKKKKRKRRQ